jgi:hypothetical protein
VQHEPLLRIAPPLWRRMVEDLHRRTEGRHESGVFLLGMIEGGTRRALDLVFYDDLDPNAYDTGICVLHGDAFGRLWDRCSSVDMTVVADAHVHGRGAGQSRSDRKNPMVAKRGHIALILPLMSRTPVRLWSVGVYEYLGDHEWKAHGGCGVSRALKIED